MTCSHAFLARASYRLLLTVLGRMTYTTSASAIGLRRTPRVRVRLSPMIDVTHLAISRGIKPRSAARQAAVLPLNDEAGQ